MLVVLAVLFLFAIGYVALGITMIREYSHNQMDKLLGYIVGGAAMSFGFYFMFAIFTQLRYYLRG